MLAQQLIDEICKLDGVDAVLLGGSRASENNDSLSDYDIYVYFNSVPNEKLREELLKKYCSVYEVGNHYFEYEDNCILKDSVPMDIIYRPVEMFVKIFSDKKNIEHAQNGYSTCFLHNIVTSKVIYDNSGTVSNIQKNLSVPYSDTMQKNIIESNMKLLSGYLPSYDKQIKKAVERNDLVSINHRTAGFIGSYFDVIFAINKMTHPGEKKLIDICKKKCKILPKDFEENLQKLFKSMYSGYDFDTLQNIITEITKTIKENTSLL